MGLDYHAYLREPLNTDWDEVNAALDGARDIVRQHTTVPEYNELRSGIQIAQAAVRKQKPKNITSRVIKEKGAPLKVERVCPKCGRSLSDNKHPRYCSHCGQALKWENGKYYE